MSRISGDTDVVFVPTQKPGDAQTIAEQLAEQGKKAKVFGTDGSNNPAQFKFPGSYVSNFAAPISLFPYNKPIIAGWQRDNPGKTVGSFGPPTYGAVQVILEGLKAACAKYHNTLPSRRVLINIVKHVRISQWILGGNFRFSTKTNDPFNGQVLHLPDPVERHLQARPVGIANRSECGPAHGRATFVLRGSAGGHPEVHPADDRRVDPRAASMR